MTPAASKRPILRVGAGAPIGELCASLGVIGRFRGVPALHAVSE